MEKSGTSIVDRKRKREPESEQGNKRFMETECPYLHTIKKYMLDFDFK